MMRKILACLLTLLGLTTACGQKHYQDADVDQFAALRDSSHVVLLDVRSEAEYQDGHLEGAINIDQSLGDFIAKAKAALPLQAKVAIYCRSGRRSASAANRLAAEGYQCVNLKGGIIAWQKAGRPVVK